MPIADNIVWFFGYVNSPGVTAPSYTCGPTWRVWGALMSPNTGTVPRLLKLLLSVV